MSTEKLQSRSQCVICGRVRYQSKMKKIDNIWLCNHSQRSVPNVYVKFDGINVAFNKCQLRYIENSKNKLLSIIDRYDKSVTAVFGYRTSKLNSRQIVIPELTIFLQ